MALDRQQAGPAHEVIRIDGAVVARQPGPLPALGFRERVIVERRAVGQIWQTGDHTPIAAALEGDRIHGPSLDWAKSVCLLRSSPLCPWPRQHSNPLLSMTASRQVKVL